MNEDEHVEFLGKHIDALPRGLNPGRDLWPGIAARLDRPGRRGWIPAAVAASLVLSALSAFFTWHVYQERELQSREMAAARALVEELRSPYLPVRAEYERHWPELKERMDPQTAAVIEKNVDLIRNANDELMETLQGQPRNETLQRLLRRTLAQEVDVYRQVLGAARTVNFRQDAPATSTRQWREAPAVHGTLI